MNILKTPEFKNLAILFIIAIIMVILYGQIDYTAEPFSSWDLAPYRKIALASPGISPTIEQPFAYRLLGPYLVGLLPVPDPIGFYAFAVALSIFLVIQFYFLLRYMELTPAVSVVTVSLFMFNRYLFGFTIWDYFRLNDLLSLNFIIVLFMSMLNGRWVVFGITLVLGAITKEVNMLMIPIVFAYLLENKDISTKWRKAFLAVLPGIVAFILLRVFIPITGGNNLLEAFSTHSSKLLSPEVSIRLLVNSFIPFSFIPLVFFKSTLNFFRTRKYSLLYVSLVFLSTLFGSNNERLMAPAFIVVYMLIGVILQKFNSNKPFLMFLIVIGFLSSLHHEIARYPLPSSNMTIVIYFGSLLIVTIVAVVLRLRLHRQHR